jgi:hypothetical protein
MLKKRVDEAIRVEVVTGFYYITLLYFTPCSCPQKVSAIDRLGNNGRNLINLHTQ